MIENTSLSDLIVLSKSLVIQLNSSKKGTKQQISNLFELMLKQMSFTDYLLENNYDKEELSKDYYALLFVIIDYLKLSYNKESNVAEFHKLINEPNRITREINSITDANYLEYYLNRNDVRIRIAALEHYLKRDIDDISILNILNITNTNKTDYNNLNETNVLETKLILLELGIISKNLVIILNNAKLEETVIKNVINYLNINYTKSERFKIELINILKKLNIKPQRMHALLNPISNLSDPNIIGGKEELGYIRFKSIDNVDVNNGLIPQLIEDDCCSVRMCAIEFIGSNAIKSKNKSNIEKNKSNIIKIIQILIESMDDEYEPVRNSAVTYLLCISQHALSINEPLLTSIVNQELIINIRNITKSSAYKGKAKTTEIIEIISQINLTAKNKANNKKPTIPLSESRENDITVINVVFSSLLDLLHDFGSLYYTAFTHSIDRFVTINDVYIKQNNHDIYTLLNRIKKDKSNQNNNVSCYSSLYHHGVLYIEHSLDGTVNTNPVYQLKHKLLSKVGNKASIKSSASDIKNIDYMVSYLQQYKKNGSKLLCSVLDCIKSFEQTKHNIYQNDLGNLSYILLNSGMTMVKVYYILRFSCYSHNDQDTKNDLLSYIRDFSAVVVRFYKTVDGFVEGLHNDIPASYQVADLDLIKVNALVDEMQYSDALDQIITLTKKYAIALFHYLYSQDLLDNTYEMLYEIRVDNKLVEYYKEVPVQLNINLRHIGYLIPKDHASIYTIILHNNQYKIVANSNTSTGSNYKIEFMLSESTTGNSVLKIATGIAFKNDYFGFNHSSSNTLNVYYSSDNKYGFIVQSNWVTLKLNAK